MRGCRRCANGGPRTARTRRGSRHPERPLRLHRLEASGGPRVATLAFAPDAGQQRRARGRHSRQHRPAGGDQVAQRHLHGPAQACRNSRRRLGAGERRSAFVVGIRPQSPSCGISASCAIARRRSRPSPASPWIARCVLAETLAAFASRYADLQAGRFDAILAAWRAPRLVQRGAPVKWDGPSVP